MKQSCLLVSTVMILFAVGCSGGSTTTSPSRTTVGSLVGTETVSVSLAPGLFGASAVDFARCLQAVQDPGCLAGVRIQPRAVGAAATAPGAPTNLSTSSSGSTVTLTWAAPASGDAVTTYIIEAGSGPGLANLANFTTNSTGTSFSAGGVGAGTYYVRVRAQNAGGISAASNESTLVVGSTSCTTAPNAPASLAITASGSTVTLTWSAPAGGCAPTSYVLQAGSSVGSSNLANSNVGNATSYVATGVGNGTYYVRVRAANAYGQSAASNELTLVVGSAAPTPTVPAGTWSYVLFANNVPLGSPPPSPPGCMSPASSGTTVVNSSGVFSIPFSGLACNSCSMSGTITGAIVPTGISGSVTASISGSGCSGQQPTPSPAAMSGTCTSAGCTVTVSASASASFGLSYSLTPP